MAKKKTVKKKATKKKATKKKRSVRKTPEQIEEPLFIGIGEPVELRKHILEPTREVIQFLQSYEEFIKIKEEKTDTVLQLKEDLKNIKSSINKLKRLLPRNKIKGEKTHEKIKKEIKKERRYIRKTEEETEEIQPPAPEISETLPPEPKPAEVEDLEKELSEIEKKLGTLSE